MDFISRIDADTDPGAHLAPEQLPTIPCGRARQLGRGGMSASLGYGNYKAGFVSLKMSDWQVDDCRALHLREKRLGRLIVQANSQWDCSGAYNRGAYGPQDWEPEIPSKILVFWLSATDIPKGQAGIVEGFYGGWSIAPILSIGTDYRTR